MPVVQSSTALRFFRANTFYPFCPDVFLPRGPSGYGSCVLPATAAGMWRSVTSRILCTLFAKHLRLLTIMAQRELPVSELVSQLQGDKADGMSDVSFTVCHRHGREVVHELARFNWRGKLFG